MGNSVRVAIVGINYAPEPTGIPVYTTGMAEYLAGQGHEVTVYTGFPYYPHWAKSPEDRRRLFRRETFNGVNVRRHYVYVPRRPSALKRMIHELSFVASSMLGYLAGPRADLTIIVSPPLFIGIPVALIARLKRSVTVFHVQDMQPDAAVDLGMLKPGPLTSFFFVLERLTYRLMHRVSTISNGMMAKIAAKGVSPDKMLLFRNWANDDMVSPRDSNTDYRRKWGLEGKFVALYSGNMGVKQGLNSLIDAASSLRSQTDVELVIVGDGGEKPALIQRATDLGLSNIQFRPLQPMEKLGELLATSDVVLVPQKEGVKDIVLPSKICNLLASGRPVIAAAAPETELGKIVSESGCGVLVAPQNGKQIADMIGQLRGAHALRERMGRDGRRYMEARLSGPMILREFMERMEMLVSGRTAQCAPVTSLSVRSISPGEPGERFVHPVVRLQAGNEAGPNDLAAEKGATAVTGGT
jgi:colanic acid biosynthesis glycosyl transferase WcaI